MKVNVVLFIFGRKPSPEDEGDLDEALKELVYYCMKEAKRMVVLTKGEIPKDKFYEFLKGAINRKLERIMRGGKIGIPGESVLSKYIFDLKYVGIIESFDIDDRKLIKDYVRVMLPETDDEYYWITWYPDFKRIIDPPLNGENRKLSIALSTLAIALSMARRR